MLSFWRRPILHIKDVLAVAQLLNEQVNWTA